MKRFFVAVAVALLIPCVVSLAAEAPQKKSSAPFPDSLAIKPTLANVPYGEHERQVLDVYKADSTSPTPVVFYIHGGGWVSGDKTLTDRIALKRFLDAKFTVVAINYRFVPQAVEAGIKPPVQWPLHDAARALQFTRSKAKEWNLDPSRIGATGGSAGAASSLWLAFHPDMADPKSADPVARESTRLQCAGVTGAQTCFDPKLMKEWISNIRYGGHAFGFRPTEQRESGWEQFYAARDSIMPWIEEYSPYHLVTADDPPVLLEYPRPPIPGTEAGTDPTHAAGFGVGLAEKIKSVGGTVYLVYPGSPEEKYKSTTDFLIAMLQAKP
jgi:acetyl esterase/lipase